MRNIPSGEKKVHSKLQPPFRISGVGVTRRKITRWDLRQDEHQTSGWTDRQGGGQHDGQTELQHRQRQTKDAHIDIQTGGQTDVQADGQTDLRKDERTYRQTKRQTYKQTDRQEQNTLTHNLHHKAFHLTV